MLFPQLEHSPPENRTLEEGRPHWVIQRVLLPICKLGKDGHQSCREDAMRRCSQSSSNRTGHTGARGGNMGRLKGSWCLDHHKKRDSPGREDGDSSKANCVNAMSFTRAGRTAFVSSLDINCQWTKSAEQVWTLAPTWGQIPDLYTLASY